MKTLVLSAKDVFTLTDRNGLREAMAVALKSLAAGRSTNFPRHVVEIDPSRVLGFMPAYALDQDLIGYKAASVFVNNPKAGLDTHQGAVILADHKLGKIKAIVEGSTITRMRTAAVSAAATATLSRPESSQLTLVGTGHQAFEHALAIAQIRDLKKIIICGRTRDHAQNLKLELSAQLNCDIEIQPVIQNAVQDTDIIVTCTASRAPLFNIDQVREGTHINAIGASRPGQIELTLKSGPNLKVYLDSLDACLREASEIFDPLRSATLDQRNIKGEIGQLLIEQIEGRTSAEDITVFKSVGLGIEDVMAAGYITKRARDKGLGQEVDFS